MLATLVMAVCALQPSHSWAQSDQTDAPELATADDTAATSPDEPLSSPTSAPLVDDAAAGAAGASSGVEAIAEAPYDEKKTVPNPVREALEAEGLPAPEPGSHSGPLDASPTETATAEPPQPSPSSPEPSAVSPPVPEPSAEAKIPADLSPEDRADAEVRAREDQLDEERETLEDIEEDAAEAETTSALPAPCTGPWDWVQLSSGEWLRGEFKRMRKKSFEMRSTRMNRQSIDWKHIRAFCFPGNTRFILDDHTVLAGRGRLENETLTVVTDEVTQTAPRADIWVMLPGLATEINRWRSTASIGLDAYSGNTDSTNITAAMSIDREDPNSHFHVDYTGTFGEVDDEANVARHRVSQAMNVYFTRMFYASLPFVEYTSDRFQNLQHRVNPGLSLGVKIFDLNTFEWSINGGLAYQYTQFISVAAGDSLRENDWGPRLATDFEWDIVTDLTLSARQQTILLIREFGQTSLHTNVDLTYEITDLLYIELGFWHDLILDPRETVDGTTPDSNDLHWMFSVGLSFD